MKNKLSMNVSQVAKKLKAMGVPIKKIVPTVDFDCEDDSIEITDTISVQVSSIGDAYMSVTRKTDDESFIFYPERLDLNHIALDIRKAMTEERIAS